MYLDPLSTFFWYSAAIFAICGVLAFLAEVIEKRQERRERWEARDAARRSRTQPGPTVGDSHVRSQLSDGQPSFSLRSWRS